MALSRLGIVILAAGKGLRMASSQPKVLHQVAGRAMLHHVLAAVAPLEAARVVVVVGPGMDDVKAAAEPHDSVVQEELLGTGHAVLAAREKLGAEALDEVFVLYGDTPLLTSEILAQMRARKAEGHEIVALAFTAQDPAAYGRMVLDSKSPPRLPWRGLSYSHTYGNPDLTNACRRLHRPVGFSRRGTVRRVAPG